MTITAASTSGMWPGQPIAGTGIPANTYVREILNGTTAVITQRATATGAGLTFALNNGRVPITYPTYAKAASAFDSGSIDDLASAFDLNEMPQSGRSVLLNPMYYRSLKSDPILNTFFASMQDSGIVTKGVLPEVGGITPQKASWYPISSNRVGFAYHKSAAILKTRLPGDFVNSVSGKPPGTLVTIQGDGGFSLLLVSRVDLVGNYSEARIEILCGCAPAERRAGLVLTSA